MAVGGQAGQLGAGAGAARRAVVGLAGAQHEVAGIGGGRGAEQLDVVDLRAVRAGDVLRLERAADAPREVGQPLDLRQREIRHRRELRRVDEEEPVAAPGHVAGDGADAGHVQRHAGAVAPARHVEHRDVAVGVELGLDRADGGVEPMPARPDAAQVRQRRDDADRAVPAHAQQAHVVEEDHARHAARRARLDQQRAHHRVAAARLAGHRGAEGVVVACELGALVGQRGAAQRGAAFEHDARGLAGGVGIDDDDLVHAAILEPPAPPGLIGCMHRHDDFSTMAA